ncbi:Nonribosomal peptide synthetase 5 [Aspergillus multicolor]|uniref:nonribosomal peptide synthetase hasD n=1 Tax=Aspergillus multicolor TaxID=41759 RepID=UPI003CCD4A47
MVGHAPTLLNHFYAELEKHPLSVAVEDGTQSSNRATWEKITYAQLDALSGLWSNQLRLAGVGAGWKVPLLSNRSIEMVAAIFAIMKLRAAYVPIDVDSWGKDRIDAVLKIVKPRIVVSTSRYRPDEYMCPIVQLERTNPNEVAIGSAALCDDHSVNRGDDLAYIIFTSGTTGRPKGVMIGQRSISRFVKEGGELPFNFNTTHGTRVLLICSIGFDVCAGVLFGTLCNGGTLVLADPPTFEAVAKTCHVLPLTPSILMTLDPAAGFDTVEKIFVGGESPSPSLIEAWATPRRRMFNSYGPTETTCAALMSELHPGSPVTIGFPISYSNILLLDDDGKQAANEGEICISGAGLALGYFEDPNRTNSAFIEMDGARIYRTGDYGKRTANGLHFCGRRDSFVKNRGFLINLEADVEPALQSFPKVDSAVAFMSQGQLVAFVKPICAEEGLRECLVDKVSSFLVPDAIYSLDEFPVTSNGKVDRQGLERMHGLNIKASRTPSVEKGLTAVEAVRRAFSCVLRLPEPQISEASSFRHLGGHSLAAVMLISALRRMEFSVGVADVLLWDTVGGIASAAKGLSGDCVQQMEDDSIERLKRDISTVLPPDNATIAPMTDMQSRMLTTNPGLSFIKTSFTFDHSGIPNLTSSLEAAWIRLHQRHGILRTSFVMTVSGGAQIISDHPQRSWQDRVVTEHEWESICEQEERLDMAEFTNFDAQHRASLSRVVLVVLPYQRTRFVWTVHHGLVDGWSMAILMRDFATSFDEKPAPKAPQFTQAAIAIETAARQSSDRATLFWREYLDGYTPPQRLRVSPPRDPGDYEQAELSGRLAVSVSVLELATKAEFAVTPATMLYAAWGLLISIYSGTDRAILGAVLSGRNLPISGIEDMVGPLINTLPLTVNTEETAQSTRNFVQGVFRSLCMILQFQWSPISLIGESCGDNPAGLFETVFALQYDFPQPPWSSNQIPEPRDISYNEATQVPLTVLLDSIDGNFEARFLYRRSHLSHAVVQRMILHFDNLLTALVTVNPDTPLGTVMGKMLNEQEYLTLTPSPALHLSDLSGSLVEAIETSVLAHGNLCAVEGSTESITYAVLGKITERICQVLLQHIQKGSVICVISDGSVLWLLAMLAIIRTGAIYCPVDQKLPRDRIVYMIQSSAAALVIHTSSTQDPVCSGVPCLYMKPLMSKISSCLPCDTSRRARPSGDDVACLIYTSGSTGLPKAVQLQHKGIMNVISQPEGRLHTRPGQRNAQMLSLGFDCCIKEIFSTLCFGGTLVLKEPENPVSHLTRVDATMATPSLLSALDPDDYSNLKIITVVGEAVPQALNDKWATGRTLTNAYGPAECSLISTTATLLSGTSVSIGRPLLGLSCYLLNHHGHPVPVGVSGEIYISGVQVTPGYLNNEEETFRRFLPDPFNSGQLMFRTGDIGRMLEDGNIEYVGREDNQIKLRGFRIDLGEVQSTISRITTIATSVAIIAFNDNLVAFVMPETVDVNGLAKSLESQLPPYAVPNRIIALRTLPTSTNNKVDLTALHKYLEDHSKTGVAAEALETDTQRILAAIWADVLGLQSFIGPSDRFFKLGGHSLLQIRVAQAISKRWDIWPLPLKEVIRHQNLRELCIAIDKLVLEKASPETTTAMTFLEMSKLAHDDQLPVSYLESEMLLNHLLSAGSPAGNMHFVCKIRGDFDIGILSTAVQEAISAIKVFQSRYSVSEGIIVRQQVSSPFKGPSVVHVSNENLHRFVRSLINKSFDMTSEPPVNISILTGTPKQAILVFVVSHIVGDAATTAICLNWISEAYNKLLKSKTLVETNPFTNGLLRPDHLSYTAWARWIATYQPPTRSLAFWKSYLFNMPPSLTFGNLSPTATYIGHTRSLTLATRMQQRLCNLATKASATMHQLMLAAVFLSLQAVEADERNDILFAAPFTHRTEPGTEVIPGLFLDRLVLRIQRSQKQNSLSDFLSAIRKSSQQALAHVMPFHAVCSAVGHKPSLVNPLFQVMVTYHTAADDKPLLELGPGVEVQPVRWRNTGGAKFPLTMEFTETAANRPEGGTHIEVDMEYDTGYLGDDVALRLEFALSLALQLMVLETDTTDIIRFVRMAFGPPAARGNPEDCQQGCPNVNSICFSSGLAELDTNINRLFSEAVCQCLNIENEVEKLDLDRSFWDFGAQSTDALRLQHLCERRGLEVKLRDIFVCQSLFELASCVVLI